jgi:hypothetical protein
MNRILKFATSELSYRLISALVLACLFCCATGPIGLFHHHNGQGPDDSQCQICYLLCVVVTAQIVSLVVVLMLGGLPRRRYVLARVTVDSSDHHPSAAPRAPPLR